MDGWNVVGAILEDTFSNGSILFKGKIRTDSCLKPAFDRLLLSLMLMMHTRQETSARLERASLSTPSDLWLNAYCLIAFLPRWVLLFKRCFLTKRGFTCLRWAHGLTDRAHCRWVHTRSRWIFFFKISHLASDWEWLLTMHAILLRPLRIIILTQGRTCTICSWSPLSQKLLWCTWCLQHCWLPFATSFSGSFQPRLNPSRLGTPKKSSLL